MAADERRAANFLGLEDRSDDDGSDGYDSEANEIQKGGRSHKRRKVERDASSDDEDAEDSDQAEWTRSSKPPVALKDDGGKFVTGDEDEGEEKDSGEQNTGGSSKDVEDGNETKPDAAKAKSGSQLPASTKNPLRRNLVSTPAAISKSGVIYLSRIPPYMRPSKLRSLLTPYGVLNRIFLAPESAAAQARRVASGGNKRRTQFVEGWVEFVRKVDAKRCVDLLNARPVGGKKGSFYRDDVWSLRYLKGFKWHHLTEQMAAEEAERETRLRAEIGKAKREDEGFIQGVTRSRELEGMRKKREAKRLRLDQDGDEELQEVKSEPRHGKETRRVFKQKAVATKSTETSEQVQRVLRKIF